MSVAEIAETLNTSVPAVDALLHRATERLRRTLARKEELR
jgi:DNA-directed RNA polymerase specialized sigma24 family protein